jgi:hypothetical protein
MLMTKIAETKPAHQTYIITAHFDSTDERFLVLRHGGARVLATVCQPEGPGGNRSFGVWAGDGLDSNDEVRLPEREFYTRNYLDDVEECWKAAVRFAYELAGEAL